MERQVDRACDMTTNNSLYNDPNSLRFCDWTGSLFQDLGKIPGIPYRHEFKLTGSVPLKWGFQVSGSLYSNPVYSTNFATNLATTNTTILNSPQPYFPGHTQASSQFT